MKLLIHFQFLKEWTVKVWERISSFVPHFIADVIDYPCWEYNWTISLTELFNDGTLFVQVRWTIRFAVEWHPCSCFVWNFQSINCRDCQCNKSVASRIPTFLYYLYCVRYVVGCGGLRPVDSFHDSQTKIITSIIECGIECFPKLQWYNRYVWAWISNPILHFIGHVITYPYYDES